MKTTLRPAGAADACRVASLLIDTRAAFMPYAPAAHSDDEIRAWVSGSLVPSAGVTVAEGRRGVVAAMAVEKAAACAWITQMAVDPAHVGQGVGSSLLAHAMRSLGRPIRLWTFQANSGARRFYERHGFVAVEFTDGHANEERCPDVLYELASTRRVDPEPSPGTARPSPRRRRPVQSG